MNQLLKRPFDPSAALPAIKQVRTPRMARALSRVLFVAVLVTPFVLLFVPWQQTVRGRGRVVAFDPAQREQAVTSRINGQIAAWYVRETDTVKAGERLVDIEDIDPNYDAVLQNQQELLQDQREQILGQIAQQKTVVEEQEQARDSAVEAARAGESAAEKGVEAVRKEITATEAQVEFKKKKFESLQRLLDRGGLEAELNVAESRASFLESEANLARLNQELARAEAQVRQARAGVIKARADGDAAIATAGAALIRTEQDLPNIERQLQELENRIRRYGSRFVTSPCDGTLYRIMSEASQVGQFVKEGQVLALIVPEATDRVVELLIDGVDASLITRDRETGEFPRVRLQFEGWPAVQFTTGWPSASVGTFGGRVMRVYPTDDGTGRFRMLVGPEPYFKDDDEWPDPSFLRQGNQAVGWIFLDRVTVGFELWRRMNGFPPVEPPRRPEPEIKVPKVKLS